MILRYATVVVAAMLAVVAAIGVSWVRSEEAGAETMVGTCDGGTIALNDAESRMLDLHNQTRDGYGLPPFCIDPALQEAARAHSQQMLDTGYFSHDSFDGETVEPRLARFGYAFPGYSYWKYAENIAWGSGPVGGADDVFGGWMNSPPHTSNILDGDLLQIGIGARTGNFDGMDGATMWTTDFGTRL